MSAGTDMPGGPACWMVAAAFIVGLSVLAVRLHGVQMDSVAESRRRMAAQSERRVQTEGPRGRILARGGAVLAGNRLSASIAVCADAYDAPDDLKAILEAYKVDFPVLKMTEKQVKEIGTIIGYPTTFYVNREGTILDITIGMPAGGVSGYKTKAVQLLEKYRTSK